MPIRVVIDTSILRRDPTLAGGPIEALSRFAEAGYVQIFIPDVVEAEFKLLPSSKIEALAGLKESLRKLRKNSPEELQERIADFESSIRTSFEQLEGEARTRFDAWVTRVKATITTVGKDHGSRVITKYFKGAAPFSRPKAREDFPDAFIAENIADLAADDEILAVAADGRLAAALDDNDRVTVFKSLKELLESDEFDELRSDIEADNVSEIVKTLEQDRHLFSRDIEDAIETHVSGSFVSYRDSFSDDKEPEEELYVDAAEVISWELDSETVEYLGEGVISVGFNASVSVSVDVSTGNPYHDDLYGSSKDLIVQCDGSVSVIVDREDLTTPNVKWSGVHLTNVARVELEEINTSNAEEPEYSE